MTQLAYIARGAADVHDHGVFEPGEMRRAAHRVGRAGCKAHPGEGDSGFSLHHRPGILGEEQGRVDATYGGRVARGGHPLARTDTRHAVWEARGSRFTQPAP